MPFLTEDDHDSDDSKALGTDQAKRESARNVVETLRNDLSARMYVQEVDPETGFPLRKTLVSGGLEYFNDHDTALPAATEYDIDAILSGDVSVDDAYAAFRDTGPGPHGATGPPAVPGTPDALADCLRLLGFEFLHATAGMPDRHVRICFSGVANFQVPTTCHKVVLTDSIVLLVTDTRSVPVFQEMDFQVDRRSVETVLVCPDNSVIPIVAPVPRTVSFEIGILRCTLFVRR